MVSVRGLPRAVVPLVVALRLTSPSYASRPDAAAQDAERRVRIDAQRAALPNEEGAEVQVAVREGLGGLQGRLRLLEQSLRAGQAVWKTPGVLDVDNELYVVSVGDGGDAGIARPVRMIIKELDAGSTRTSSSR